MLAPADSTARRTRWLATSLAVLSAGVFFCVWWPEVPIGTDLPLHLTQIAQMQQWLAGELPPEYETNWATPYLLGYLAVFAFAQLVPLTVALKLVLTFSYLGLPAALLWYLTSTGRDPRLAVLGFPAIFTAAYHWGFLSFMVAAPLVVVGWRVVELIRDRHATTRQALLPWAMLPLSVALFYCHAIAWGLWGVLAALLVIDRRSIRGTFARWLPLVLSTVVALGWISLTASQYGDVAEPSEWPAWRSLSAFGNELLTVIRDVGLDPMAIYVVIESSGLASLAERFGYLLLLSAALLVLLGRQLLRPKSHWRWPLACLVVFAAALFAPSNVFGTALVMNRLPVFLPIAVALAIRPGAKLGRVQAALLTAGCMAVVTWHMAQAIHFGRELADAQMVAADLPANARLVYLPQDQTNEPMWFGPLFLHYDNVIRAQRPDVRVAFESSFWWPQVIRLRLGERARRLAELTQFGGCRADPTRVDRHHIAGRFEWALLRGSPEAIAHRLAHVHGKPVRSHGAWCLAQLAPLQPGETLFEFGPVSE